MSFGKAHFNFKAVLEASSNDQVTVGKPIKHAPKAKDNPRAYGKSAAPKVNPIGASVKTIAKTQFVKAGQVDLSKRYAEVQAQSAATSSTTAGTSAYTTFTEANIQQQYTNNARGSSNKKGLGGAPNPPQSAKPSKNKLTKLYNEFPTTGRPQPGDHHKSVGYWPVKSAVDDVAHVTVQGDEEDSGFEAPRRSAYKRALTPGILLAKRSKTDVGPYAKKATYMTKIESQIDALTKRQTYLRHEIDRLCSIPYSDHEPTARRQDDEVNAHRRTLVDVDQRLYVMHDQWDIAKSSNPRDKMFEEPFPDEATEKQSSGNEIPVVNLDDPPSATAGADQPSSSRQADEQLERAKQDQFIDFDFSDDTVIKKRLMEKKDTVEPSKDVIAPVAETADEANALIARLASIIKTSDAVLRNEKLPHDPIASIKAAINATLKMPPKSSKPRGSDNWGDQYEEAQMWQSEVDGEKETSSKIEKNPKENDTSNMTDDEIAALQMEYIRQREEGEQILAEQEAAAHKLGGAYKEIETVEGVELFANDEEGWQRNHEMKRAERLRRQGLQPRGELPRRVSRFEPVINAPLGPPPPGPRGAGPLLHGQRPPGPPPAGPLLHGPPRSGPLIHGPPIGGPLHHGPGSSLHVPLLNGPPTARPRPDEFGPSLSAAHRQYNSGFDSSQPRTSQQFGDRSALLPNGPPRMMGPPGTNLDFFVNQFLGMHHQTGLGPLRPHEPPSMDLPIGHPAWQKRETMSMVRPRYMGPRY